MLFKDFLRRELLKKNMSCRQLNLEMGVYDNWVVRVIKGEVRPGIAKAQKACELLGCTNDVAFLLHFEDVRFYDMDKLRKEYSDLYKRYSSAINTSKWIETKDITFEDVMELKINNDMLLNKISLMETVIRNYETKLENINRISKL